MDREKEGLYFILDEKNSRNGITDRLKAMVGLYYIARCSGIGFHIIHHAGFDLRTYLKPNLVPWPSELSDISILPWRTKRPDRQRLWRELFRELFQPTDAVLSALSQTGMPERYIAVNARFINSLGYFEGADYNAPLPEKTQVKLIDAVLEKVSECVSNSDLPAVISSDSIRYVEGVPQNSLYKTQYPRYAAIVGDKPFIRI